MSNNNQCLQGVLTRKSFPVTDPQTPAHYYNYIANAVKVNQTINTSREYNLTRRATIAYHGYEAVLNKKKRPPTVTTTPVTTPSQRVTYTPNQTILRAASLPATTGLNVNVAKSAVTGGLPLAPTPDLLASATGVQGFQQNKNMNLSANQQLLRQQAANMLPRTSELVAGTPVLIQSTADLIACGARNLAGKTGTIMAVPQVYGQGLYSVYVDQHETMFQVPYNALTVVGRPQYARQQAITSVGQQQLQQQKQQLANMAARGILPIAGQQSHTPQQTRTTQDMKMEHSYQLHRLMQQQYREIQMLQQQYADCRLVNPAALNGIQNELSKLRLVHLSQVQALKNKQQMDLMGK